MARESETRLGHESRRERGPMPQVVEWRTPDEQQSGTQWDNCERGMERAAGSPLASAALAAAAGPAAVSSPSHEVAASLLRSASLRATSPRARTRSRSPAPMPKRAPRAPRRSSSVACVVQLLLRSRDWSRVWPPRVAHQDRLSSCASHASLTLSMLPQLVRSLPPTLLDPLHPPLRAPRPLVPRSLRPTPMTNGTHSLTHTASPHLLEAPRPPSPSRPTPLELVGVLATSAAAVSAKPPSAPCGGTSSLLLLPLRVLPVWRGNAGGLALGTCMLSRVTSFCWSLQSSSVASRLVGFARRHRRWPWLGIPFDFFENSEKSYARRSVPLARLREIGFFLVATLSGEASSQVQDLLLLDVSLSLAHGCGDCRWCHDEAH